MDSSLLTIVYGLASAATWGAGDFSGGMAAKRTSATMVIIISQMIGGLLLFGLALLFKETVVIDRNLFYGSAAGIAGVIGLMGLYTGLATGRMGIVAPLTAVFSAAIPIIFSLITSTLPSTITLIGFGFALVAVWFLSASGTHGGIRAQEFGYALVAGVGFSLFFILIDQVEEGRVFWPLVAARLTSISVMFIYAKIRGEWKRPSRANLPVIALAGLFDAGGNAFFTLAAQAGRLDIAAILSSMYPATTVLLARILLKEHLSRTQWIGVAAAFTALVLIAL
jgi:uncharacterized membrane protein